GLPNEDPRGCVYTPAFLVSIWLRIDPLRPGPGRSRASLGSNCLGRQCRPGATRKPPTKSAALEYRISDAEYSKALKRASGSRQRHEASERTSASNSSFPLRAATGH